MTFQARFSSVAGSAVRAVIYFSLILSSGLASAPTNAQSSAVDKISLQKNSRRAKPRSGPGLTPTNPAVTPGNSIILTSASPVTWALSGVGTLTNQTTTSVTYTAPASVVAQNQMLGCPVLPNDTIFNTPIDNLPLDPNSSAMIAAQSHIAFSIQPSWGISYADTSTPTKTLLTFYGSNSFSNFAMPLPGPNLKRESGDYVGTFQFPSSPDHHVMTVRRTDCSFFESYDDYLNGYVRNCNDGTPNCNVQSAVSYGSANYNYIPGNWGTDAGGFLLAPLVWHLDEIKNGSINHAVRFTEGLAGILFGSVRWPAASSAGGCAPATCPNAFPMGARLRLKASFNTSNFSPTAQVLLTALKTYGMVLTDTGSNTAIQTTTDLWSDPVVSSALTQITTAGISVSNFEVVDESSLQLAPNSYAVCPFNATCMGAANTYEHPTGQAVITATAGNGSSTSIPVALKAITIGLGVPAVLPLQAGSYGFQIPFWVNNTSNQTVNWTLQSGTGSVTAGGVYTPPATTTNSATTAAAVLNGTSAADPNITAKLFLTILPAGANPVGSVRIDSGANANVADGNGNTWLADPGAEGTFSQILADYPNWSTTNSARVVYQSAAFTYANDLRYTFAVPNGNYRVHLLFGVPYNGCPSPCGRYASYAGQDIHSYNPQMIETQGVLQSHYFDFGAASGYAFATPADLYVPAKVTNNLLQLGVLATAPDLGPNYAPPGNKYNIINGVEVLPDASAPHWTIDTQQQTTISAGQTLRPFYVTDWYTGRNDPTWSVKSQAPGCPSATFTGSALTLASGACSNGQPVVVQATDGTYTATTILSTTGGTKTMLAIVAPPPVVNHFSYKRAITINHANVSAPQTNFPVALSISDPSLETVPNGGHVQQANGYDIVLTSDAAGSNRLNWEVEKYDPMVGSWIAHVKIPALSNVTDTVIYAFYGNPAVISDQSTPSAVWDSSFKAVYHFATVTTSTTPDSTVYANNAVSNSSVAVTGGGLLGSGAQFSAGAAYHLVLPVAVLNASAGTISAWLNPTIASVAGQTFGTASQTDPGKEFRFAEWSSYSNGNLFGWNSGSSDYTINLPNTAFSLPVNAWSHVVYTWNQSTNTQVVYLNGVAQKTVTTAFSPYTPVSNFWLGTDVQNPSYSFGGVMDEVRFSDSSRTATWIASEYANQNPSSTFISLGTEAAN